MVTRPGGGAGDQIRGRGCMVTRLGRGASHEVGGKAGHEIKERGWRLDQRKGLVKLANFPT